MMLLPLVLMVVSAGQAIVLPDVKGRIDHMAFDAQDHRLYVAALGNNSMEVVDVDANKRVGRIEGIAEPQGICVTPKCIVVASGGDGKCRFYDRSLKLLGQIDDLEDADNVRFDSKANRVYVGYGNGALAVIDPEAMKVTGTIKLEGHPESFALAKTTSRIYVNVPSARQIAVVDREKGAVVDTWRLTTAEANFPMTLDERESRLYVVCRKPAVLLKFDIPTGKLLTSLPCCQDADDIFFDVDSNSFFVSGGEGFVYRFQDRVEDRLKFEEKIKTAPGARTSLWVREMHRLFVAVPKRGDHDAEIQMIDHTR